jgi:DNA-binding GntR family transcriptional regulator
MGGAHDSEAIVADKRTTNGGGTEPPARPAITAIEQAPSVEERITRRLEALIVSGQLPEGTPLRHRDLARDLGVSPTPIRAALNQLERDGLVVVGSTSRAAVSRLTLADLEEIYAVRRGLEGLAARRGAPLLSDADLAQMARLLDDLRAAAVGETLDRYLDATWRFHAVCYEAAGRPRLTQEVERLFWRAVRYYRLLLSTPPIFVGAVHYHERFLVACEERDGNAAERVIEEAARWTLEQFQRLLREDRRDSETA